MRCLGRDIGTYAREAIKVHVLTKEIYPSSRNFVFVFAGRILLDEISQ